MRFFAPVVLIFLQTLVPLTPAESWSYLAWAPLVLSLGLFPIVDLLWPKPMATQVGRAPAWFFDFILIAFAIVHVSCVLTMAHFVSHAELSRSQYIGFIISTGIFSGGLGITFAHELVHRRSPWMRALGQMILTFVCYGHFTVSHILGHHRNVATPHDPATARSGEWLVVFLVRSIPGIFFEAFRLRPRQTFAYVFCSGVVMAAIGSAWGSLALIFFIGQSLMGAILLETIDYVEHYGLERRSTGPGQFEMVKAHHSWDSAAPFTNSILINLQRHSDHHMNVLRKYPELGLQPEARKLPTGYPGMIWLALLPPQSRLRKKLWA
jgi:alkane 1-monooxygenase